MRTKSEMRRKKVDKLFFTERRKHWFENLGSASDSLRGRRGKGGDEYLNKKSTNVFNS